MQAFPRIVKLIVLAVLLVGCREPDGGLPPTAIGAQPTAVLPTPTIMPSPTAVLLATPSVAITETAVVSGSRSIGDPYIPALGSADYDVQQYDIALAIDPVQRVIDSTVTLTAVSLVDHLSEMALDFVGFEITELLVDGQPAAFAREPRKMVVQLPTAVAAGGAVTLRISYRGTPVEERSAYLGLLAGLGLRFTAEGEAFIISEPDGARYWLPSNDHPRDKAAFRFELTVPAPLTAVANGLLLDEVTPGLRPLPGGEPGRTFIWEHGDPMATYLATIAVGEYVRLDAPPIDDVVVRHYVFPDSEETMTEMVATTDEVVRWMSELFGAYPFESVGFVTVNLPGVSLETQTMILLSTQMIGQQTAVHELAHMWFGDWVSLDSWQAMWRNEGFATYVQLMWEYRDDPEGLELEMAAIETAVAENNPNFPLGSPAPDQLFSFNTYLEGALLVHTLRQTVGDDAFFGGLRLYFERYGGGTASDAQFQAVMEEASGMVLDDFFAEWLD